MWRLAALFGLWLLLGVAHAQQSGGAAENAAKLQGLSAQERVDLIAKLDDTQARDLLLHYLSVNAAGAPKGTDDVVADLDQEAALLRQNAVAVVRSIFDLPAALATARERLSTGNTVGTIIGFVALIVLIAAGVAAEALYASAVRRFRDVVRQAAVGGGDAWLRSTFGLLLLDVLGIAAFAAGYVLSFLVFWHGNEARRELAAIALLGIVAVRLTRTFSEFLLGPANVGERILPLTRTGAQYFHDRVVREAIVGAIGFGLAHLLGAWSGNAHLRALLMMIAGVIFLAYAATIVWKGRHHAAAAFIDVGEGGQAPAWPMRALALAWAPLVIIYIVAIFALAVLAALLGTPIGVARGLTALVVMVVVVPALDRFVGFILARRRASVAGDAPLVSMRQDLVLRRIARLMIVIVAVVLVLGMFGVTAAARQTFGGWMVELAFNIGAVVLVAYILREVTIAAVTRKLASETAAEQNAGGAPELVRASRLKTILPLLLRALQVAIVVIAALMILSSLGVNIGPLLAGAGIFGLAIGFGAQTLVKDLISGLFFLLDDAFRVGEYIEVAGFGGQVERINVRSLSLRTPLGAVHTIPFGGIDAVANYSRDWAIVKMEFRVTYDTDMSKVKKIFRKIGEELAVDPELAPGFLQPFKFQGVKAMEETGILLRGKFMAVPGAQFQIRKQIFERVQKAFAEADIQFAQRRVQVALPPGLDMDDATKDAISKAAGAAIAAEPMPVKN